MEPIALYSMAILPLTAHIRSWIATLNWLEWLIKFPYWTATTGHPSRH